MTSELVVSSFYQLRDPAAFDRASRLLLARLRLTGMDGVRSYRFLGGARDRRLVAVYDSAPVWMEMQERIAPWAETVALRAAARLVRTDLYGPIPPQVRDWMAQTGLGRSLRHQGEPILDPPAERDRGFRPIWRPENAGRRVG